MAVPDPTQVLKELSKIAASLQDSIKKTKTANFGGTNTDDSNVRRGRGGDANSAGKNSTRSIENLNKIFKESRGLMKSMNEAIMDGIRTYKNLDKELEELTDDIVDSSKAHKDSVAKNAKSTADLIKTHGIQSKSVSDQAKLLDKLNNKLNEYSKAQTVIMVAEEKLKKIKENLAFEQAELNKAKNSKKTTAAHHESIKVLQAEEMVLNDLVEVNKKLIDGFESSSDGLGEFIKNVGESTIAFDALTDSEINLIKTGKLFNNTLLDGKNIQKEIFEKLRKVHDTFNRMVGDIADSTSNKLSTMQRQKTRAMQSVIDKAPGFVKSVLSNYMSQVRYNMPESNFISAGGMGLEDSELSEVLGKNQRTLGAMTKSSAPDAAIQSGALQRLQQQSKILGFTGKDAAEFGPQLLAQLKNSGIQISEKTGMDQIAMIKAMSHVMRVDAGEMAETFAKFTESGAMSAVTANYGDIDPKKRLEVYNKELLLRMVNNRLLGRNNENLIEQDKARQSAKYGSIEQAFRDQLSIDFAIEESQRAGVQFLPEEIELLKRYKDPSLTAPQKVQNEKTITKIQNAQIDAQTNALIQSGGRAEGTVQAKLTSAVMSGMSGVPWLNQENLVAAENARQDAIGSMGEKGYQEYLNGKIPENQKEIRTNITGLPMTLGDHDSHMAVGEEHLQKLSQIMEGISKHPLLAGSSIYGTFVAIRKALNFAKGVSAVRLATKGGSGFGGLVARTVQGGFNGMNMAKNGLMSAASNSLKGGLRATAAKGTIATTLGLAAYDTYNTDSSDYASKLFGKELFQYSDQISNILKTSMGIDAPWLNDILRTYEDLFTRTIGAFTEIGNGFVDTADFLSGGLISKDSIQNYIVDKMENLANPEKRTAEIWKSVIPGGQVYDGLKSVTGGTNADLSTSERMSILGEKIENTPIRALLPGGVSALPTVLSKLIQDSLMEKETEKANEALGSDPLVEGINKLIDVTTEGNENAQKRFDAFDISGRVESQRDLAENMLANIISNANTQKDRVSRAKLGN